MPLRRMQQWGEDVSLQGEGDMFASMDMGSHGEETRECIAPLFSELQQIVQSLRQTVCASDSKRYRIGSRTFKDYLPPGIFGPGHMKSDTCGKKILPTFLAMKLD